MEKPVVVIGSGAGGLPSATAIVEQGYDVVLIERGAAVSHSSSKINQYNFEVSPLPWPTHEHEWSGENQLQRVIALGGSTLRYQAVAHLPSQATVQKWGLDTKTFYKTAYEVKSFLAISGHNTPHHPLNRFSQHLFNTAQKLGWEVSPTQAAILSKPHSSRPACNHCGMCVFGCLPNDKTTTANSWLPRANKTGRLKILTDSKAIKLNLGNKSTCESVDIERQNRKERIPAQAIVLSAGALETPYLLKKSQQTLAPNGIGNKNIGRHLIETNIQSQILLGNNDIENAHAGIPIDLVVKQFEKEGVLLYQGRNLAGIVGPVSLAKYYALHEGPENIRRWMQSHYKRVGVIAAMMEVGGSRYDQIDFNKKSFSFNKTEREKQNEAFVSSLLKRWQKASGFKSLWQESFRYSQNSGAMLRGSCRMGKDPNKSAVNLSGKLHDYNNIFVSDASILNPGLIAHPSLTLQILGFSIGQSVAKLLKGQKPT